MNCRFSLVFFASYLLLQFIVHGSFFTYELLAIFLFLLLNFHLLSEDKWLEWQSQNFKQIAMEIICSPLCLLSLSYFCLRHRSNNECVDCIERWYFFFPMLFSGWGWVFFFFNPCSWSMKQELYAEWFFF